MSDIKIKMIKEENGKQSKQQRNTRQSNRKSKNTVMFSKGPKLQPSFHLNSQSSNTYLPTQNSKSFKRFGSKPVIPPYTGFISEESEDYSLDAKTKTKAANKENLMGNDKKKLKRIGKKAWVTAFKQTITETNGQKERKISRKLSQNDFHQFQQNAKDVRKNKAELEEETQSILNDKVSENEEKMITEDELFVKHANSEVDLLSANQSSLKLGQSPSNSDVDQTLESYVQKTQIFIEVEEDEKRSSRNTKPIEYETYSINVNSHDSTKESIKRDSKMNRNSRVNRQSANIRLQEFLLKAIEKRPSVLKKGEKTNKQPSNLKRPSSKQNNFSVQNSSFVSISCEQNSTKKSSISQHNYKPLPEPNILGQTLFKKNPNNQQKLVKKGISEHQKRGSPNFQTKKIEKIGIYGKQGDSCCSVVIPMLSKIQQLRFVESKEVIKCKSMHNSAHIPSENKYYTKNTDKTALGSSMKRNHKQLEMNKYIQQAKQELKYRSYQ